jgi:hypothetical protein
MAFAGVARAEFLAGGKWRELPLYAPRKGALAITVPGLVAHQLADGASALSALDLVAIEPSSGATATLTGVCGGILGHCERLAPDDPVRVHGSVLAWLSGGGSTVPWLAPAAVCLLDAQSAAAEWVLLDCPLVCDDAGRRRGEVLQGGRTIACAATCRA